MISKVTLLSCVLAIAFSLSTSNARAGDTLTNRQVYNFNVGDTFDYEIQYANVDGGFYGTQYFRRVLMQKTYSSNLDTLYLYYSFPYGGGMNPYDTIVNLDSISVFKYPIQDTSCQLRFTYVDTSYPGFVSNNLNIGCFESGGLYRYTQGLGRTYYSWGSIGAGGYGSDTYSEQLIYYAHDSFNVGTPYYIANGSYLINNYIPLPETCAVWIRTLQGSYSPIHTTPGTITEEVRTGNKIHTGGRNYVELICRIENAITGHFTPDSLIGYFYNDTPSKTAYFVQDTGGPPSVLCAFNMMAGEQCSTTGSLVIDTVLIGGSYRTAWYCSQSGSSEYCSSNNVIEGIGNLEGLIPITNYLYEWNGYSWVYACGSLSCFSVCGQTLYPNDALASCSLLTGIKNVNNAGFSLQCSPNPFSSDISISFQLEKPGDATYTVSDLIGQTVYSSHDPIVSNGYSKKIDLSSLSSGVYLLAVSINGETVVKKIVKE